MSWLSTTIASAVQRQRCIVCYCRRVLSVSSTGSSLFDKESTRDTKTAVQFPNQTTAILFCHVPIEPTASAAGVRTAFLLDNLLRNSPGITAVHVVSSSPIGSSNQTGDCKSLQYHILPPNRSSDAQALLERILPASCNHHHVLAIFDRFYAEEMYSFHVHKHAATAKHPTTLVLDLQDLHSLRRSRQDWIQTRKQYEQQQHTSDALSNLPIHVTPTIVDDTLLRELASIHRCDLTLTCSSVELQLLVQHYQIPPHKLCWAPLFPTLPPPFLPTTTLKSFAHRRDFVFVGGFRHEPNVDAVHQLVRLWPRIRQACCQETLCNSKDLPLPPPSLYVYGAHASDHLRRTWQSKAIVASGIVFGGHYAGSVHDILSDKRVMLSPLRFGAGIKGKHVDAWHCCLPVVTTLIGSEGMCDDCDSQDNNNDTAQFGGIVATSDDEFVHGAVALYTNEHEWNRRVAIGQDQAARLCGEWDTVGQRLVNVMQDCEKRRSQDYTQSILWHQTLRSTEYFSKYIEYKETAGRSDSRVNPG